jgi:ureidoglycolate hydrolase
MPSIKPLVPTPITPENFQAYGQLIVPTPDDKPYDAVDAQLSLDQGIPRFYLMRLSHRGRQFHQITHHRQCTQCLGAVGGQQWYIAVAPPGQDCPPQLEQLQVFFIQGHCFIKLAVGTWHAGPYFDDDWMDFYNLELADTNEVDHASYDFLDHHQLIFEIV